MLNTSIILCCTLCDSHKRKTEPSAVASQARCLQVAAKSAKRNATFRLASRCPKSYLDVVSYFLSN